VTDQLPADPAVTEPLAPGRTRLGAYAICVDPDGRLLMVRLAPIEVEAGAWTIPGGGVEFGEHPDAAVLRELHEETGLTGEIESVEGVFSHVYPNSRFAGGADLHFLGILYRVRATGGTLTDERDGTTDRCAWLGPDDMRQIRIVKLARQAIEHALPGVLA
jgi:8-oxo-dGTP pyrophosphatase MutT (NUDIX family)